MPTANPVVASLLALALISEGAAASAPVPPTSELVCAGQEAGQGSHRTLPGTRGEQFQALTREWNQAVEAAKVAAQKAGGSNQEQLGAFAKFAPDPKIYGQRFLALADAKPEDGVARDVALWVLYRAATNERVMSMPRSVLYISPSSQAAGRAVDLLIAHHANDVEVSRTLLGYPKYLSANRDRLLHALFQNAQSKIAKGTATLALGQFLLGKAGTARMLRSQKAPRRLLMVTEKYENALRACDPDATKAEAIMLLERVVKDYADVPLIRGGAMVAAARERALVAQVEEDAANKLTLGQEAESILDDSLNLAIGKRAPEIEGVDLDGKRFKLSDYRGKVVVLVFWATWCGPCIAEVPHEREMVERLKNQPFALLGLNCDADKAAARKAVEQERMTWPNWYLGSVEESTIAKEYYVLGLPRVFVLDAEGIIRAKGGARGKPLDEFVDKQLAEMNNPKPAAGRPSPSATPVRP